jgi:hypothetical protein
MPDARPPVIYLFLQGLWRAFVSVPAGGSAGQALLKGTNNDYDVTWGEVASVSPGSISEGSIILSDVTTDNVTSIAHGFAPKSPADATKFLNGASTPGYTTPVGNVAADTIWDAKGDLVAGTGADTAAKRTVGSNGQVLLADSTQTTGLIWGDIDGGSP